MAGTGNPYLEEYAQRQHLYGNPVDVEPQLSSDIAQLVALKKRRKKMREEQAAAAASQAKYATGFPDATKPEPTDLERRIGAYQETWNRYLKDSATTPRAPSQDEMLAQQKMTNPLLVQQELDEESASKEAWEEYWNAADKGVPEAIDALLPVTGQMWDAHRAEESQLDEARKFIGTLDPATQKDLIDQYDTALKSSWAEHQKRGKQIEEYSKRMDAAIARRAAGERERGAAEAPTGYFATIQDRLKDKALPSLAWFAHQLGRGQRMVAANLGYATDLLAGERDLWDTIKKMAPNTPLAPVGLFLDETQDRGELMNQQVKQAAGTYVAETEKDVPGQNFVRALYNPVGAGLVGTARTLASAEEGFDIAKAAVTGSEYIPAQTGAERREDWGGSAARLAFEIATDPGTLLPGVGSKVFAKVIKPIEPALDAMTRRSGIKATAKALRAITVGGAPLEDADWARYALAAKSAEVDKAAPVIREAYEAQAAIERKFAEIPPELQAAAREAAPKLRENVPRAEWKGVKLQGVDLPSLDSDSKAASLARAAESARPNNERLLVEINDTHIQSALKNGRIPVRRMEGYIKIADPEKAARINALQGTYYYFDPSSSEYLPAGRVLDAVDKVDAALKLGISPEVVAKRLGVPVAELAPGLGRFSKELNIDIRRLAERGGYDAVLLRSVKGGPGGRATTEVIDLMPRDYSVARIVDAQGRPAAAALRAKGEIDRKILTNVQDARRAVSKALPWLTPEAIHKWFPWADINPNMRRSLVAIQDMFRFLDAVDYAVSPKWLDTEVRALLDAANLDAQTFDMARRALNRASSAARVVTHYKRSVVEPREVMRIWGKVVINSRDPEAARIMARALGDAEPTLARYADAVSPKPTPPSPAPSPAYEAALKDIPIEHRASVVAYAETIADRDEMLKKLTADTIGRNVELSDGILEGHFARRFSPEAKQVLALNPEIKQSLKDLSLAQHYHATGQAIPETNQFAKRKFSEGTTFHDAEMMLKEKFGEKFKDIGVWDRDAANVMFGDYLFLANAAKRQADVEEFARVFGAVDDKLAKSVPAEDVFKRFNAKMPEEFAGKFIPESRLKEFEQIQHIADPGRVRQVINRITGWVARSVLATPASVAKDIKGQIINMAITDPNAFKYVDEAGRLILSGKADDDLAALIAAGLERPSFDQVITPSTIKATEEFGGGLKGRIAGAIEESGFTGSAIRGVGKTVGAVPGLGLVGKGVEALGRGVGKFGRASLSARQTTESVFRLATYKAAKARGLSRDEALREVAKWWGDFSQLSKLESNVLKGFVMFFSWQLRALKIGAAHLVDHPMRSRLFLSLAAGNVSDDPSFPEWARRQGGSIIGKDAQGNPRFMSLGAGSYFDPLNDILQGEVMQRFRTDGFSGIPKGLAQQTLRRLAPLAQAPIEYMTNYDSFSGGQIYLKEGQDTSRTRVSDHGPASALWLPEGLKKLFDVRPVYHKDQKTIAYIHVDPTWNWLFNKLTPGIGAELAGVNPLADPRKEPWEAAARALGFPTYSVRPQDVQKQVAMKVRTATEALRKEFPGSGLAMNEQGIPYFDRTSELGQQMAADNERWDREAKELGKNPDAYKRFKMGGKYEEALRLLDLAHYLDGWRKGIESEQEALPAPESKALEPLKRLAARQASKDQKPRRLRGRG